MKSNNSILNHTYIIMKNKIIALLKDETLQKIEVYNQLLGYLSTKRGLFAIRNFQNGYSDFKYDSIIHEIKKDYEITDLEIFEFSGETEATDEVIDDSTLISDEEISEDENSDEEKEELSPELQAFYQELEVSEDAKTGLKLHEEYPFLDDENTPDAMKALVTDKFAAYRNFAKNHAALVVGLEENEANEKIYELAKAAVENFSLEADIKKELDFYKVQGKVLGKHPKLNTLRIEQEINELSEAELVEMKIKAQKNASKARGEIEKQGTSDNLEKRLSDWTIREDRATKRLEKEFKKK